MNIRGWGRHRTSSESEFAASRRRPHYSDAARAAIWTAASKIQQAPLELGPLDGVGTQLDRRLVGALGGLSVTGALEQLGMGCVQRLVALERRVARAAARAGRGRLEGRRRTRRRRHGSSSTTASWRELHRARRRGRRPAASRGLSSIWTAVIAACSWYWPGRRSRTLAPTPEALADARLRSHRERSCSSIAR